MKLEEARPLNDEEKRILGTLLEPEFPGVEELRAQVPHAVVVGCCDCGCPTVEFSVSPTASRSNVKTWPRLAPFEATVKPVESEPPGEIILFVDDGRLSCLEYVSYDDPSPREWPSPDRLNVAQVRTS